MKRALVSVSNKEGIVEFCQKLLEANYEIVSTGGTAKLLRDNNLEIIGIEEVTGNPEAFDGRMKSISFQIGSALLFDRSKESDVETAKNLGIKPIDLVVCNLYPFEEVVKKNGSLNELVENIDIGGPTMIRAAAKNFNSVAVITDCNQYHDFLNNKDSLDFRKKLALKAFQHTAQYDSLIASVLEEKFLKTESTIHMDLDKGKKLRYGENPSQKAWLIPGVHHKGIASANILQGKELSYNNILDIDAAWKCNNDLHLNTDSHYESCVTIIKHANPCGVAMAKNQFDALSNAWSSDPISSFGSIICVNERVQESFASWLSDKFVEVIVAPSFSDEARDVFSKKKNLRLVELAPNDDFDGELVAKSIYGGYVVQNEDQGFSQELLFPTDKKFNTRQDKAALFGQIVTKHLKSNAISLVKFSEASGYMLYGAGMGNPNRLVSVEQAFDKAKQNNFEIDEDVLLISDAFFPFRDNIDMASKYNIKAIVQPGGSIKDQDVIDACNEKGLAMAFTNRRHFRH